MKKIHLIAYASRIVSALEDIKYICEIFLKYYHKEHLSQGGSYGNFDCVLFFCIYFQEKYHLM